MSHTRVAGFLASAPDVEAVQAEVREAGRGRGGQGGQGGQEGHDVTDGDARPHGAGAQGAGRQDHGNGVALEERGAHHPPARAELSAGDLCHSPVQENVLGERGEGVAHGGHLAKFGGLGDFGQGGEAVLHEEQGGHVVQRHSLVMPDSVARALERGHAQGGEAVVHGEQGGHVVQRHSLVMPDSVARALERDHAHVARRSEVQTPWQESDAGGAARVPGGRRETAAEDMLEGGIEGVTTHAPLFVDAGQVADRDAATAARPAVLPKVLTPVKRQTMGMQGMCVRDSCVTSCACLWHM